jgi:predicted transcriptional regulator
LGWRVYPFPDEPEGFRLRGRSYRSETDIMATLLGILDSAGKPVRKTRLIQYANLNTRSFEKYVKLLLDAGLVRATGEGYVITGKGRLALTLLESIEAVMTPPAGPGLASTVGVICKAAQARGWKCRVGPPPFDVSLQPQPHTAWLGLVIVSCSTPQALRLVLSAAESLSPGGYRPLLLCTTCPTSQAPPEHDILELCNPTLEEAEKLLQTLTANN